jgi:replicative DNA helicase
VSFDSNIGHDYEDKLEDRFNFYHSTEEKIPFDLDIFNKITKDGFSKKTLNLIIAGTGVGKSIFLCHYAAACYKQNKNVLYITCEMAEEKLAERIDANIMNINIEDMYKLDLPAYKAKFAKATKNITSRLIIKEYPTGTANVMHFRHLLNDLKLKKNFVPDVIIVDYINICASARHKSNSNANSYTLIKSVCEELRGLAIEYNVPILSCNQQNRSGIENSDPDLTNTSESLGIAFTADFMIAMIRSESLDAMNQVIFKQLKNRYNDLGYYRRFVVGLDRPKMKFYDVEESAQKNLMDSNFKTKQEEDLEDEYDSSNIEKPAINYRNLEEKSKKNFKDWR